MRKLTCELPAMSRPLYETLLTGRKPVDHGVVSNGVVRRSLGDNLFARVRAQGGVTAAAAYHWVSELYVSCPFDRYRDRILVDGTGDITHGVFYWDDAYPDGHLFADAEWLIRSKSPDFLLLHPMNVDDAATSMVATASVIAMRRGCRAISLRDMCRIGSRPVTPSS